MARSLAGLGTSPGAGSNAHQALRWGAELLRWVGALVLLLSIAMRAAYAARAVSTGGGRVALWPLLVAVPRDAFSPAALTSALTTMSFVLYVGFVLFVVGTLEAMITQDRAARVVVLVIAVLMTPFGLGGILTIVDWVGTFAPPLGSLDFEDFREGGLYDAGFALIWIGTLLRSLDWPPGRRMMHRGPGAPVA